MFLFIIQLQSIFVDIEVNDLNTILLLAGHLISASSNVQAPMLGCFYDSKAHDNSLIGSHVCLCKVNRVLDKLQRRLEQEYSWPKWWK